MKIDTKSIQEPDICVGNLIPMATLGGVFYSGRWPFPCNIILGKSMYWEDSEGKSKAINQLLK